MRAVRRNWSRNDSGKVRLAYVTTFRTTSEDQACGDGCGTSVRPRYRQRQGTWTGCSQPASGCAADRRPVTFSRNTTQKKPAGGSIGGAGACDIDLDIQYRSGERTVRVGAAAGGTWTPVKCVAPFQNLM